MNLFKTSLLATALIAGGAIAPANAGTASNTFNVTINIETSCVIDSAETIAFGNTSVTTPGAITAEGDIVVHCTNGTEYDLALDGGEALDVGARIMTHDDDTDTIDYQLYQAADLVAPWGKTIDTDTVAGTGAGFGTGRANVHTVYAQAKIEGDELPGIYSDTITATITF